MPEYIISICELPDICQWQLQDSNGDVVDAGAASTRPEAVALAVAARDVLTTPEPVWVVITDPEAEMASLTAEPAAATRTPADR